MADGTTEGATDTNTPAPGETTTAGDGSLQTTQTTTDGGTTDGSVKGTANDKADPGGTPGAYQPFAVPDGVTLDATLADGFSALAHESNMTQEQAQKFVDLYAARLTAVQNESDTAWVQQVEQWGTDAKADAEIGGPQFEQRFAVARDAIARFGTVEVDGQKVNKLKDVLDETGLGNHPELIRFMYRVGKAISEDGFVPSGAGPGASADRAAKFYPNSNMK